MDHGSSDYEVITRLLLGMQLVLGRDDPHALRRCSVPASASSRDAVVIHDAVTEPRAEMIKVEVNGRRSRVCSEEDGTDVAGRFALLGCG